MKGQLSQTVAYRRNTRLQSYIYTELYLRLNCRSTCRWWSGLCCSGHFGWTRIDLCKQQAAVSESVQVLSHTRFSLCPFLSCAQTGRVAFLLGTPAFSYLCYQAHDRLQTSAVVHALGKGSWFVSGCSRNRASVRSEHLATGVVVMDWWHVQVLLCSQANVYGIWLYHSWTAQFNVSNLGFIVAPPHLSLN